MCERGERFWDCSSPMAGLLQDRPERPKSWSTIHFVATVSRFFEFFRIYFAISALLPHWKKLEDGLTCSRVNSFLSKIFPKARAEFHTRNHQEVWMGKGLLSKVPNAISGESRLPKNGCLMTVRSISLPSWLLWKFKKSKKSFEQIDSPRRISRNGEKKNFSVGTFFRRRFPVNYTDRPFYEYGF